MNIYRKYQSKNESCETIQKLISIHNINHYNRIFDHLQRCNKCSPVETIRQHQVRESTDPKFYGCSSTTSLTYAFRYHQRYKEAFPEIRDICVWFIIHATSWNNKIKFAKWISHQEAIDAVIHQVEFSKVRMVWPPSAYQNKYWKFSGGKRIPVKPNFTKLEKENFLIFEVAARIGVDFVKSNRMNVQSIFDAADVMKVMNV